MYRNKRLNLRLAEKEYRALESIARQESVSISEAARLMIREGCQRRGMSPVGFMVDVGGEHGQP